MWLMRCTSNPNTWEMEAERSGVQGQPGLQETLSQQQQKDKAINDLRFIEIDR